LLQKKSHRMCEAHVTGLVTIKSLYYHHGITLQSNNFFGEFYSFRQYFLFIKRHSKYFKYKEDFVINDKV